MLRRWVPILLLLFTTGCLVDLNADWDPDQPLQSPTPSASPSPGPSPTPPAIDQGDGSDGPFLVPNGSTSTANTCTVVTTGSASTLEVGSALGLQVDDALLVYQVTEDLGSTSNDATAVNAAGTSVGLWEVRRIQAIDTNTITLASALLGTYASGGRAAAQACHVPDFTTVTVETGGRLTGLPWDGSVGGVVAFFADNTVNLDGTVDANGIGFRGGNTNLQQQSNSEETDDNTGGLGGAKGEGLHGGILGLMGRGNYANGGGGGNAHSSGGGGGGNYGAGGIGGFQDESDGAGDTQGRAGSSVSFQVTRLSMGGGGGGGHAYDTIADAGDGGAGGGLVLMFVLTLNGTGTIASEGADGGSGETTMGSEGEGGGGGGAGGSLYIDAATSAFTGTVSVRGGTGGTCNNGGGDRQGPGGGGGGGTGYLFGVTTATSIVTGGANGTDDGTPYGAAPGADGNVAVTN